MRYEPPEVDFTWEREWRLKTEFYNFQPYKTYIILPDDSWAQRLREEHNAEQQWQTLQYSQVIDELLAIQYEEPFPLIRLL